MKKNVNNVRIIVNNLMKDEEIKIVQHKDYLKYSLDSILLSYFVTINYSTSKILDIGTGNAPIPLILSTRTNAKIVGVEIQNNVYKLAYESVKLNNLNKQITIINDDIKNFSKKSESDLFDVITCNPPYFKNFYNSIVNNNQTKTFARHEKLLTLQDVCKIAKKLLKNNGKFALIHRTERLIEVITILKENNLEPKKIQLVYSKNNNDSELFLIESVKNGKSGLKFLYPKILNNKGVI